MINSEEHIGYSKEKKELLSYISPLIGSVNFREPIIVYEDEEVIRAYLNIDSELHYFIKKKNSTVGEGEKCKITSSNLLNLSESELLEVWRIFLKR